MRFCGFCGSSLPTNARFCGECGRGTDLPFTAPPTAPTIAPTTAPPTAHSPAVAAVAEAPTTGVIPHAQGGRGGLLAVVGLLGLAAAAVGIFLLTRSDDSSGDRSSTTAITSARTLAGETTTTTTTVAIDPVQAASDQLQLLITQDRPTVDTLVGSWAVQLSAKRVGLKADGIEYGPVEVLADHTTLRDTYGAILVDAGAFQFQSDGSPMIGWFLTIVPQIFGAQVDAAQWCTDNGLAANRCLARRFPSPNS